jgi:hypothetical protein
MLGQYERKKRELSTLLGKNFRKVRGGADSSPKEDSQEKITKTAEGILDGQLIQKKTRNPAYHPRSADMMNDVLILSL